MRFVRSLSDCPYINPPPDLGSLVEIADGYDRPLMLTPLSAALRRKLPRRIVLVGVRDSRGQLFLTRRAPRLARHPGLWDISVTGDVLAGESLEGAALRELRQRLGIEVATIRSVASLPYTDSGGASLSATFFLTGAGSSPPSPAPEIVCDGMFVDADELQGLVRHQPDLLTPELIWAVRSGWVFGKTRRLFASGV
ncbi:MAG: NUDIX domain-containing protein [Desulfovibrionaceae bacterium]|nr:NUDIX domain-containing protein [Desulfovibrionaceae bacterium]